MQFFTRDVACGQQSWYAKTDFVFSHIWLARNNAIFRNTSINCDEIYRNIETSFIYYLSVASIAHPTTVIGKKLYQVAWRPSSYT